VLTTQPPKSKPFAAKSQVIMGHDHLTSGLAGVA
jgi:hypothetical protein